jgi:hypothetical protein
MILFIPIHSNHGTIDCNDTRSNKFSLFNISKRSIFSLILLTLIISNTSGTTRTWNSTTGINKIWTTASNWSGGIAPVAGDDIVFNSSAPITFSTMPASVTYHSLTISQSTVTFANGSTTTLTLGANPNPYLSIASGAALTLGNHVNITLANTATANISGNLTVNTGSTFNTNGAAVTTVNGTITNSGTVTCQTASKLLFNSNSQYIHAEDLGTIPTATWDTLSTCLITGIIGTSTVHNYPLGSDQTFGNFTWNCPKQSYYIALNSSSMHILGNLEIDSTGTGGGTNTPWDFSIEQDLTVAGNFLLQNTAAYRVCYNINRILTINGNVTISPRSILLMNSSSSDNMTAIVNVAGNFNFPSGAFINSRVTGNYAINNINFNGSGNKQTMNSGGSITNLPVIAMPNLVNFSVSSPAYLQMADGTTLIGGGGTFAITAGATLGITSATVILTSGANGNIQVTGTRTFNAGSNYIYNGTLNQSTGNGLPTNLTGSLTVNNTGNTVTLNNVESIANGGSVNLVSGSFSNGTNLTMASTSQINRSGGTMTSTPIGSGVYNVNYTGNSKPTGIELSGSGFNDISVNLTSDQTLTLDQNRSPDGNCTVNNGSTFDLNTFTLNRSTSGGIFSVAGTLSVGGTSGGQPGSNFPTGFTSMNMSGGTVNYDNATSLQTIYSVPSFYNNLNINNPAGATIIADVTVTGTLLETPNSILTIPQGKCVTANTITNTNPNQIYIHSGASGSNGSLIFHNDMSVPVYGTVEMYSLASWNLSSIIVGGKYKWQFIGIPVHSLSTTSPTFDGAYIRQMHENNIPAHWEQLNNLSPLTSFTGYEITQAAAKTYVFQGQLENKDYPVTQLPFTTSGATFPGQSLIGNPYTSAIEISKIQFGSKMLKTVYLYNTGSESDWINAGSGTLPDSLNTTTTAGQYTAIPQAWAGHALLQHQIPSMQAFLVKAQANDINATLYIPYSSTGTVVADSVAQRSKRILTKASSPDIWTIVDVKGSRFSDRMWLFTEPTCTHGFDNGWDGEKFFGSNLAPQIFALEQDGDYQVNSVDDINNTYLGFQSGEDSIYTLTFTHQNLGLKYGNVYLTDSETQEMIDITASGTQYTFLSLPTDTIARRFKIVTLQDIATSVNSPVVKGNKLSLFGSNHSVYIDNKSDEIGFLYLYDMTGRFIQKYNFAAQGVTTIPTDLSQGNYLAKCITKSRLVTATISL